MNILAIGTATLDLVNQVDDYPVEDSKVRAIAQYSSRGGNAANTLVTLRRLGHQCSWGGVLADDEGSRLIVDDLTSQGISSIPAVRIAGRTPTSYIALSRRNGSRTIIHHRELREFTAVDFQAIDLSPFDWVHFEGREPLQLELMLVRVVAAGLPCSLEVEKPREGIRALFPLPQLLLFSRGYAESAGFSQAVPFLDHMRPQCRGDADLVCAWGDAGAWALSARGELLHSPAFPPARVVDTLGAGDLFNGGVIDGLVRGCSLEESLTSACRIAGEKCGRQGL